MNEEWCSPTPEGAASILASAPPTWWISGGWAIELFVGRPHRTHADIDIGCFRQDLESLLRPLDGWDIRASANGELRPLHRGELPSAEVHTLWCRPRGSACWLLEIVIEEREADEWVYRRDRGVRLPADDIVVTTRTGLRYLRPEIQLLYKSKNPRERDDEDFGAAWPLLPSSARSWLCTTLRMVSPKHAWLVSVRAE